MATTVNGIRYPLGSDTVNIEVDAQNLATDIDTKLAAQVFGLSAGAGNLPGYNGTNTSTILGNPKPGYVLEADSTNVVGVKWSTGHFPNMYFIASAIETSGSQPILSFTNIPQIFQSIKLYVYCQVGTASERINLISMNNANFGGSSTVWSVMRYSFSGGVLNETNPSTFELAEAEPTSPTWLELTIHDYADQGRLMKPFTLKSAIPRATTNNPIADYSSGIIAPGSSIPQSDISSLSLQWGTTNSITRWAAYLYGVK